MTPGTAAIDDLNRSRGTEDGTPWSRMKEADLTTITEKRQFQTRNLIDNEGIYREEGRSRRLKVREGEHYLKARNGRAED